MRTKVVKETLGALVRLALSALLAAIACGSTSRCQAATLHVDSFDADVQNWFGADGPTHVSTGPGQGYLQATASSTVEHLATYNLDGRWTGDYSSAGANLVRVAMMVPVANPPLSIRVVLFGTFGSGDRWTSTDAAPVPNDGQWHNYAFSLLEEDLVRVQGTGAYAGLMSEVSRIMLRHNPTPAAGGVPIADGLLNLDDVELATLAPPQIPGDFNADGVVDGLDVSDPVDGFRVRFGNDLDGRDILVWQQHLGEGAAVPAVGSVPEPVGAALALVGLAVHATARRRER